jgi:U3 small nucleolar RNA-associated protein 5
MTQAISLIDSAFDNQGAQFGSAIPWLDTNKIRVHQVFGTESFEHTLEKGSSAQSIQWIIYKGSSSKSPKKSADGNQRVIAVGTNKGSILLYSPTENKVVAVLSGTHSAPVTSISQLESQPLRLWTCDFTGSIVEWDLTKQSAVRQFNSPEPDTRVIRAVSKDSILIASTNIYVIDLSDPSESSQSFAGFVRPVSRILLANTNSDIFVAYSRDRNVSVTSISENKTTNLLVAQSNVESVTLAEDDSYLAVMTENGTVELFANPLVPGGSAKLDSNNNSIQPKKRQRSKSAVISRKSDAEIKITRPGKSKSIVKLQNVFFKSAAIIVSWLENGSIPVFDAIPFKSDTGELLQTKFDIEKPYQQANANNKSAIDPAAVIAYNESNTVISSGKDVHSLDDVHEDDEEEEEQTLAERLNALEVEIGQDDYAPDLPKVNGVISKPLAKELSAPGSFATLLAQALKTNDHALLETCFSSREDSLIKVSIQRLDSSLAVKLLERLAERMARTPVRAGELNIWIKWVMITHGAYLVTVPNLLKTLSSLHSILSERVSALPKLLALQGRLQLLSSQIELRREVAAGTQDIMDEDDDDDDEEVEYVEDGAIIANGEEDLYEDEDEDEDDDEANGFIDIEAAEGSDSEQFEDEDLGGFSDVEDENIDAMSEDEDLEEDDEEEDLPVVKNKSKKMNGKY